MIPWSQLFVCDGCGSEFDLVVDKRERDLPVPCNTCGLQARPTFSVPRNLRASHPDGTRRRGFAELREASEIEAASFDLPPADRGKAAAEIAKLRAAPSSTGKPKE
jgi:DNA-directed RNA polymerase subunit RPC12/RpoP